MCLLLPRDHTNSSVSVSKSLSFSCRNTRCPASSSVWSVRLSSVWSVPRWRSQTRTCSTTRTPPARAYRRPTTRNSNTTKSLRACPSPSPARSTETPNQRWERFLLSSPWLIKHRWWWWLLILDEYFGHVEAPSLWELLMCDVDDGGCRYCTHAPCCDKRRPGLPLPTLMARWWQASEWTGEIKEKQRDKRWKRDRERH